MSLVVVGFGSNTLSLNVQRQLGRASDDLSAVSQRLSSGQRINKASDDAAGLAIASSLRTDARIFTQGIRNLNDGLSAMGIAESAMDSLGSIVERNQELSTQAMSGTFRDTQRASVQREVTALQAEWNRIVESTSFNGTNLLTGENTRTVLQGGKGVEGTLAVQIGEGRVGGTQRVSADSSGNEVLSSSDVTAISADGRFVAFHSFASTLVPGDTNGTRDAFLKDTLTGVTTRINTDSAGNQVSGGASYVTAVSANGRYVAFHSSASTLVSGDTNGVRDVFLKDTLTGSTTRISTDSNGNEAIGGISSVLAMSADGRYVAFHSFATNLVAGDTNGVRDAFIKDTLTGVTTRVNTDSAGNQATGLDTYVNAISSDGRYVAFHTVASNLVAGDTNTVRDAFVKDTLTNITTRVSTDSFGNQATGGDSLVTAISADGRYVAFHSFAANLVTGDTNGVRDAFIKDMPTGITTRVNTDSAGNEATGGPSYVTAISADGRYVAFNSDATNLVQGDTNTLRDAFIKDTLLGTTIRISTDSQGNQSTGGASTVTAISADGRSAVFQSSATNLVASDTNTVQDSFLKDLTRLGVQQMSGMVVSNRASAAVTLGLVQSYRDELIEYRSNLGATTSRISTFVNTLSSQTINYKAAESRIADADIAQDAATAVATQIRQQVASSLLGQANQAPQIGLILLRNA